MEDIQKWTLILLIGAIVILHPLYLWPNLGETPYRLVLEEEEPPEGVEVLQYDELSENTQRAVLEKISGESSNRVDLWEESDSETIETLKQGEFVEVNGQYYSILIYHLDDYWMFNGLFVIGLSILGGGGIIAGYSLPRTIQSYTPVRLETHHIAISVLVITIISVQVAYLIHS